MIYFKEDIKNNIKIDIMPMIDIIFSILAFLIISSLYLTRVDTISADLPMASNTIKQDNKFISISIDKAGNLFINKRNLQLQDLKVQLVNLLDESKNLVVLNADKNVPHGYVINVLDILRSIDGLKLAISTKSINY